MALWLHLFKLFELGENQRVTYDMIYYEILRLGLSDLIIISNHEMIQYMPYQYFFPPLAYVNSFLFLAAPPSVKLWPQVLTVPVGARVVLECQVSGHPLPSISWVKRGHSKQTGGKIALG